MPVENIIILLAAWITSLGLLGVLVSLMLKPRLLKRSWRANAL